MTPCGKERPQQAVKGTATCVGEAPTQSRGIKPEKCLPGVPNWMQFSRVRTKSASLNLMICRLLAFSMFFTHLLAWPWGSIIRGHRLALLQTHTHTHTINHTQMVLPCQSERSCNSETHFWLIRLFFLYYPNCSWVLEILENTVECGVVLLEQPEHWVASLSE